MVDTFSNSSGVTSWDRFSRIDSQWRNFDVEVPMVYGRETFPGDMIPLATTVTSDIKKRKKL